MAILDDERGWRRNLLDIFYDSDNMAERSLDLFDDFPITCVRSKTHHHFDLPRVFIVSYPLVN